MADRSTKLGLLCRPSGEQRLSLLSLHNQNFPKLRWNEKSLKKYFSDKKRRPLCITIGNKNKLTGLIIG